MLLPLCGEQVRCDVDMACMLEEFLYDVQDDRGCRPRPGPDRGCCRLEVGRLWLRCSSNLFDETGERGSEPRDQQLQVGHRARRIELGVAISQRRPTDDDVIEPPLRNPNAVHDQREHRVRAIEVGTIAHTWSKRNRFRHHPIERKIDECQHIVVTQIDHAPTIDRRDDGGSRLSEQEGADDSWILAPPRNVLDDLDVLGRDVGDSSVTG